MFIYVNSELPLSLQLTSVVWDCAGTSLKVDIKHERQRAEGPTGDVGRDRSMQDSSVVFGRTTEQTLWVRPLKFCYSEVDFSNVVTLAVKQQLSLLINEQLRSLLFRSHRQRGRCSCALRRPEFNQDEVGHQPEKEKVTLNAHLDSLSSKVSKETLYECVQLVLKHAKETKKRKFMETVDLQIGLKNYDPQKDKRFSGTVKYDG